MRSMPTAFALAALFFILLGMLLGSLLRMHLARRSRLHKIARDVFVATSRLHDFRISILVVENFLCILGPEGAGRQALAKLGEAKSIVGEVELALFDLQRAFHARRSGIFKLYDKTFQSNPLFNEVAKVPARRWAWEDRLASAIRSIGKDLNLATRNLVRSAVDDELVEIAPVPANLKH